MAKMTVTSSKAPPKGAKAAPAQPLPKHKPGDPTPVGFDVLFDVGGAFTVRGVNAGGQKVDISGVATLTASTSDATVFNPAAPVGMLVTVKPAAPPPAVGAKCVITCVATWGDGSVGPFTLEVTETAVQDPVVGLTADASNPVLK